ncbi:response regulator [bacterium]|nr:response regulator [bacterium]
MKILIAEDRKPLRDVMQFLLADWGFEADVAANGRDAAEKIHNGNYDLCLMDVAMPIMDGCEATKLIRRKEKYIPILAVTAGAEYERQRCLQAGMDDLIEKPFDVWELYDKIKATTVKTIKFHNKKDKLYTQKEMPMDSEQAKELRELEKRNLCKMSLCSGLTELNLIVHKNVPQMISREFIGKDKDLAIFLDRSEDKPAECYIYRKNFFLNARFLSQEKYDQLARKEDQSLEDCNDFSDKKEEA